MSPARRPYEPPLVTSDRFPPALAVEQDRVPVLASDWDALDFRAEGELGHLRLGSLSLRLVGQAPAIQGHLEDSWGALLVDGPAAADAIEVSLREVERLPMASPIGFVASDRRGDRYLMKMRGAAVVVDTAAGRASALVMRDHPSQEVANLLRLLLWTYAPSRGRFLLRGAAVETAAGTVILLGPAQAGKSTAARLAAPRRVLTDDAVLLGVEGDRAVVTAIGLRGVEGSEGLTIERVPVTRQIAALLTLRKAAAAAVTPLSKAETALAVVCGISLVRRDGAARGEVLAVADAAASRVPGFELAFHKRDGGCWERVEAAIRAS